MADSLTSSISVLIKADDIKDMDLQDGKCNLSLSFSDSLASGTAADQAAVVFHDQRTLAATSESLDLAGTLTDTFGGVVTFAKVRCLHIENVNTTAGNDLVIGGATASALNTLFGATTDKITVRAGGLLMLWAPKDGYSVTSATADLLKIDAGTNTVVYNVIIIGT